MILGADTSKNADFPQPPKGMETKVQTKLIPCERCQENAALLIFAEAETMGEFEDYARLTYQKCKALNVAAWIIKPPTDSQISTTAAPVMQVWPNRGALTTTTADEFNMELDTILSQHCESI